MLWPDDWGRGGRLDVFPVAVKGSRPELQAQSVQGRLEVEEFPSRRECERKRGRASVCQQEQHSFSTREKLWRDLHVIQTTPFGEKLVCVCVCV